MKYPDSVVLVFAKAPVAGKVNTRLIPEIGIEKATRLQHDLVHGRLKLLTESDLSRVILYCMPDITDDFFTDCSKKYAIELKMQCGIDLGERMSNAINEQLDCFKYVLLVGTDAPVLGCEQIENAFHSLTSGDDAVIVPAEDGGYVLVGMNAHHEVLFHSVPWGTDRVLTKTRANAIAAGLKLAELETCWDIDRPEDYYRWLRISDGC